MRDEKESFGPKTFQAFRFIRYPFFMKRTLLVIPVIALYVLHQDFWFWRTARPFVFGFIPIGLFYHACFAVAASLLMWMLVKFAWPSHLEDEVELESHVREDGAP